MTIATNPARAEYRRLLPARVPAVPISARDFSPSGAYSSPSVTAGLNLPQLSENKRPALFQPATKSGFLAAAMLFRDAFLIDSAGRLECDATHSKQRTVVLSNRQ